MPQFVFAAIWFCLGFVVAGAIGHFQPQFVFAAIWFCLGFVVAGAIGHFQSPKSGETLLEWDHDIETYVHNNFDATTQLLIQNRDLHIDAKSSAHTFIKASSNFPPQIILTIGPTP